ncbi:TonB-dependent receptor [Emticicia fluvialis]|uniref:TonB-dependent receptor n=1 Tax=Emticicia fluvialis TaxID=2974474 RepID=UPI002166423B|nr:TonB-dependent receptor [Emticicia fluvialis]
MSKLTPHKMKSVFTVFMLMCGSWAWAQNGTVKGRVITSDGKAAEFVNVILKGTNKGTLTDTLGNYQISQVKAGDYTAQVSFIGLKAETRKFSMKAGETVTLDFTMDINANQLQEVVVAANPSKYVSDYPSISLRLKTPLLEIPQNIQVITKQLIQDQQIFDMLEGVTRNVSGATRVEHWDTYAQINMRGSQIAAFRNGMNVQSTWGPLVEDMSMVERIEFVKGPAGFMLANGEPSGFYNVVTKKPTGINKGEASMTVGSFNTYRSTLDFDGKLTDNGKILYRLNLMGQTKGSHRDFEFNNRISIAPVLKFQFTPSTSLTAEYTYQFNQMSVIGSNYAFSKKGMADLPVNATTAEPNMYPSNINDNTFFLTLAHSLNSNWKLTGQLAYMTYKQIGQSLWPTGFSANGDTLIRAASVWDVLGITKVGQFFVNGDAKTGVVGHRILAGLDMGQKDFYHDWSQGGTFKGPQGFNIYNPVHGNVPASAFPKYDRSLSLRQRGVYYAQQYAAIYAQDEIRFFEDKLRLTLAGRYTSAQNSDPYSGFVKSEKFTPRVGLSYSIDKNTSAYAVFDQAFLPQAGADAQGKGFKPVTGNNKEIGLKREWLGGLWSTSVAAYNITKNNVLTADPNNQFFSVQLGQTQVKGFEFDLRGQLIHGLDLTLNYAYTDAKVTKDTQEKNVGVQTPGSSKNIANAWLSYKSTAGSLQGFGVSLGGQLITGRSSWYVFDGSKQGLPNYFKMDGAVSYQANKFAVALNVNNILNAYLYMGAYYTYSDFYYWQAEAKRNLRLSINYKF